MGDFSLIGGGADSLEEGLDLANVTGTAITASGSTNTMGSWVELLAAASNTSTSERLFIYLHDPGGTANALYHVNIGVGGAGSEEIIIPSLYFNSTSNSSTGTTWRYEIPIRIPNGVRVSAQCQSSTASAVVGVHISRVRASQSQSSGLSVVNTYGANSGDSSGTAVTRSTAGTFGSWVEITAATSEAMRGFIVAACRFPTSWSNGSVTYEVGVGSAGNEEAVYSGELIHTDTLESSTALASGFIPATIASGERIAIRAAASAANTDFDLDYIVYGVS